VSACNSLSLRPVREREKEREREGERGKEREGRERGERGREREGRERKRDVEYGCFIFLRNDRCLGTF
jgi:hypothetical protein